MTPSPLPLVTEALGWTLLHFLWQGAAAAAMLFISLALFARASARLRYVVSCGALLAASGVFVATFVWQITSFPSIAGNPNLAGGPAPVSWDEAPMATAIESSDSAPQVTGAQATPPGADLTAAVAFLEIIRSWSGRLRAWLPMLDALWAVGVGLLSLRLFFSWRAIRRLCCSGCEVDDPFWLQRFAAMRERLGVSRPVRLLASASVGVPFVIGCLRPIVLVPASMLTSLTPGEVEAIFAHELAHVRRHDFLVNLVQNVLETLLFYHPAVWWISAQVRRERENCCDDVAAAACGGALGYAQALVAVEKLRPASLMLAASGGSLAQRIRRLAGVGADRSSASTWLLSVVALFLIATAAIVAVGRSSLAQSKDAQTPMLRLAVGHGPKGETVLHLNGGKIDEATLKRLVEQMVDEKREPQVLLSNNGAGYQEVIKVLDLLTSSGLRKISLESRRATGDGKPAPTPVRLPTTFTGAEIIACVGPETLLASDVLPDANRAVERSRQHSAEGSRPHTSEEVESLRRLYMAKFLEPLIDIKLVVVEGRRLLPKDAWIKIVKQFDEQFDNEYLPELLENENCRSLTELDLKLRDAGSSLESVRRQSMERSFAQYFVEEKVRRRVTAEEVRQYRDSHPEAAETDEGTLRKTIADEDFPARRQEYLDELRKRIPIWTVFALADADSASSPPPADAPADTLHKTVRVINQLGEPVAGATITPWGIRSVQGSHGLWAPKGFGDSIPPTLVTDADGKATIPFPRFARKAERIPPRELTCRVQHPDYAESDRDDVSVAPEELEKVATIVLQPGARVEVTALDKNQPLPADRVRAQWTGSWGGSVTVNAQGRLELPRLPAGTQLVRLAYAAEQGAMLISDVQTLTLADGERRELDLEFKPALRVLGRLDPAVPRPVKNGRIVARIVEPADDASSDLDWGASTTVNEDGTFVLEDLPHGELQVTALCDGYVATPGTAPAFAKRSVVFPGSPQVFHLSDAKNEIVVKMISAASCRIRVLDPGGNPVGGANCRFSPNVQWWDGGSQIYCAPTVSTAEALRKKNPKPRGELWKQRELLFANPFSATTDADGLAIVENLPAGQEQLAVLHDDLEMPIGAENRRVRNVGLKPGQRAEVTVKLQKKGAEFIGSKLHAASEKSLDELVRQKAQEAAVAKNVDLAKQFDTAEAAYAALAEQNETARDAFRKAMNQAGDGEERAEITRNRPRPLDYVPAFFLIAEKYPNDPAAIYSLVWIARHQVFGEEAEKALTILASKYSQSREIADYVATVSLYGEPFEPYEAFLRTILQDNPDHNVQGAACVNLARYLKMAVEESQSNLVKIALEGERSLRPENLAALNHLKERGFEKVAAESEALFQRAIKDYADVRLEHTLPPEVAAFAKGQLFELRNLSIGKPALEIEGTDISGAPLKLSDYRGKVVVLDFGSHRTCGVCRAIYPQLRSLVEQFEGQPFALIGINEGDDLDELKELASKGETTWRVVWDGEAAQGPIGKQWVVDSMPTVYVLDQTGVIRNKGFLQGQELIGTIQMLLKEMAGTGKVSPKSGEIFRGDGPDSNVGVQPGAEF